MAADARTEIGPDAKQELIRYVQSRWGGPSALRIASDAGRIVILPTGFVELDALLGGGLPAGRVSALRAGHSCGGTTIAHTVVAASQRRELVAVYLDASRSFDPASALRAGVDLSRLTLVRPGDPLEALAIATTLARSGGFDLILFDCLSKEHDPGILSTWLGCMVTLLHSANTAMLLLAGPGERPDTYHGGRALAHYSSVILSSKRTDWLRNRSGEVVGMRVLVRLVKDKAGAPPGGSAELSLVTSPRAWFASPERETRAS